MSSSYYTIVNGAAGGGRSGKLAPGVLQGLERQGIALTTVSTERPKHAIELARGAAAAGHRRFLSVGGDGTTGEIVHALAEAGVSSECEIAILPLGTGNSFVRDFDITTLEQASAAIVRGKSRPVDVLRLTHLDGAIHFINTMGTGFVAQVGELTNDRFKSLGPAGYVVAVLSCLIRLRYEQTTLRYGGTMDDRATILSAFSNSQYTGGAMRIAPDAQVADGLVDVVRASPSGRAALLRAFAHIFKGKHVELANVWVPQTDRVDFVDPVRQAVLIDGDLFHLTPVAIDVLPSAIRVVA